MTGRDFLLAIDTTGPACALALAAAGAPAVVGLSRPMATGHAEALLPLLETLLRTTSTATNDIGRIAVITGPGSFTGIRVGIAAARGLALALSCPVRGWSALAILAADARRRAGDKRVLALLPSRGSQLYGQLFDAAGQALTEPLILERGEIAMRFAGATDLLAGFVPEGLGEALSLSAVPPPADGLATALARHAQGDHSEGWEGLPAPLYLRDAAAIPSPSPGLPMEGG